MPASAVRLHAATLAAYVCVALAFAWPLPLHFSTALPGSPGGDTGVYLWNLWVFRHEVVVHGRLPFFTQEILAVTPPVPLTLHNYTTFANVLAFPLLPWLGTVATFNALVIASAVASAYAMFLFARARVGDVAGAWLAGLLFGFSPFINARVTEHFSLVQAAPLPIFGLLLYRIWLRPTVTLAVATGAVVAWAYLCDPYYAVYCLLMTGYTIVSSMVIVGRRGEQPARYAAPMAFLDVALFCVAGLIVGIVIRGGAEMELLGLRISMRRLYNPMMLLTALAMIRIWLAVRSRVGWRLPPLPPLRIALAAAVACAALLSPILYAMSASLGQKQWITPRVYWRSSAPGVDLLAFFAPNPLHPLFGRATREWITSLPNGFAENVASIPWVAVALIVAAVFWTGLRLPRSWLAYTAFFSLLALGPFVRVAGYSTYIPGPWALLRYVPLVGAARMPTRLTVIVTLGAAMLLAFAVRHLRERTSRPRLAFAAAAALLLFELLPAPRVLHSARVPTIFKIIAEDPRPVRVLHVPFGLRDGLSSRGNFSADAQFFQTFHEKPLVDGYLSRLPDGEVERFRKVPVLRVLMRLSENRHVDTEMRSGALETIDRQRAQLKVGYVVVNRQRAPDAAVGFVQQALGLKLVASDGEWELYEPDSAAWPTGEGEKEK